MVTFEIIMSFDNYYIDDSYFNKVDFPSILSLVKLSEFIKNPLLLLINMELLTYEF